MTSESARRGRGAVTTARNATPGNAPLAFEIRPHNCFACGELNAQGLHLQLHLERERCWVDLTLERQFEGWEGIAHGGILCTILDEVMAWSLVADDTWGVTAKLSVEFRKPVEVGARIRAEGWVVETRRRACRTAARIVDPSGAVVATAEGLYVAAPEGRKRELQARYAYRPIGGAEAQPARMPEHVDGTDQNGTGKAEALARQPQEGQS